MTNNGSGNQDLLQKVEKLKARLVDSSPQNAFATANFPAHESRSFLEFARLLPSVVDENREIDPTWQIETRHTTTKPFSLPEDISQLLEHSLLCLKAPTAPIVAILGLLNAGKSSLVSTYLSAENRRRILIGAANEQGTHRFVLWLPQSWRNDPALWHSIEDRLFDVFGCESEALSNDFAQATLQYNDTRVRTVRDKWGKEQLRPTIEIPLVATDSHLDRWGIALMDCPDVQTGFLPIPAIYPQPRFNTGDSANRGEELLFHERSQSIADSRLRVLASVSPLCSAFILVLPANAMHDQTVSRLLGMLANQMPHAKQILAVNRVPRRYRTSEIREELDSLYGNQRISRQYMAYGFDGPQQRERLPSPPDGLNADKTAALPLFFRIDQHPVPQPPDLISGADWLLNIGAQLDKKSLFADALASTLSKLRVQIQQILDRSCQHVANTNTLIAILQRSVADACLDFSSHRNFTSAPKIRLQVSRQIIQQVSRSLERTAPWWAMPGRWTSRLADASKASIANATNWLQFPKWFTGKTEAVSRWIRSSWTSGQSGKIVTADVLLRHLQLHDRKGILKLDQGNDHSSASLQTTREACQRAIDRFQGESLAQLDEKQLDEFTLKMWAEMPMSKRLLTGLAPAGILFAPLLAVVMVPLDFGGSAVLVFASMKELLIAGAFGAGLVLASPDSMPQIAESEAAWQQLGDLYAVLCDELGFERPDHNHMPTVGTGSQARKMPSSRILKPNANLQPALSAYPTPTTYELNSKSIAEIEGFLAQIR